LLLDSGLKLGHRVHEVSELQEVAKSDITIKTALLESRFLEGSKFLWFETENELNKIRAFEPKKFILEKIQERRELRKKYPLMMEPNLKEGVGGFRDANLVYWIGKVLFNAPSIKTLPHSVVNEKDYIEFRIALEFLFKVRSALHLTQKSKTDQLRLDYIPDVAALLGYKNSSSAHMQFAKKVNKSLRIVWLYARIWINALASPYVPIYKNYLKPKGEFKDKKEALEFLIKHGNSEFHSHPLLNQYLLHIKNSSDVDFQHLIPAIFKQPHAHSILTALSEVNGLGEYIQPLKKVEALPQFDGYHRFPVDTHLIACLKALENIEDPYLQEIYDALSPEHQMILKLATLLHDAGKGRLSDHHPIGAKLFKAYTQKIGLSPEDIELGSKLVLYHNRLSQTAQKEDIYSPLIVAQFTALFPSKLELDMLLLLTYADTTGVGSNIYNEFTARLFKGLHKNALDFLDNREFLNETHKRLERIEKLKSSARFKELPKILQTKIINIESNIPFIRYKTAKIIEIATEAKEIKNYKYKLANKNFLTIEIIKKSRINMGYLLSKLRNLNLANMDIIKLFDDKKYFKIDFNQKVEKDLLQEIGAVIEEAFLPDTVTQTQKPQIAKEDIIINCTHGIQYAQMKLTTKDQKGLLAHVMNVFEKLDIDIVSAKLFTRKDRTDDLFLVEKNGNFCDNEEFIKEQLV
ncbi:MAG TPA: HD domain-containing protein, partial [Nitratifractor sp.]|nr:HD domain-containing protein [Nitratifractor sp.]